ncbi:MAG: methyltransferase [Epsilonproteobacteria bacterium]|nr:MAG: methyltransferase [Campylobacterota bacterium]
MTTSNQIQNSFDKKANIYENFNIIQKIVSKAVVRDIKNEPKKILELGCGSGQIYKQIHWEIKQYKAVDFSQIMCDQHPKDKNLQVVLANFDDTNFLKILKNERYDYVVSSSALQWSNNIDNLLKILQKISPNIAIAMFTSNTFKNIFDITKKISPILDKNSIKKRFDKYFLCEYETHNYKLKFENKKDIFRFIKNSGVSAGVKLNFIEAKNLWQNYDKDYLQFEVIYINTNTK